MVSIPKIGTNMRYWKVWIRKLGFEIKYRYLEEVSKSNSQKSFRYLSFHLLNLWLETWKFIFKVHWTILIEIKEHLKKCLVCRKSNLNNYEIFKKCKSDFEAKVTEGFYIKKENPNLNKQLFNSGILYTLKVYF